MNETESITGRAPFYLPLRPCLRGLGEEQVSTSSRALAHEKDDLTGSHAPYL
jgi:hypothetical protein